MPKYMVDGIVELNWFCVNCRTLIEVRTYVHPFRHDAECPKCGTVHEFKLDIWGILPKKPKCKLIKSR